MTTIIRSTGPKTFKAKRPGSGSYKRRARALRGFLPAATNCSCGLPLRTRRGWLECSRHGSAGVL